MDPFERGIRAILDRILRRETERTYDEFYWRAAGVTGDGIPKAPDAPETSATPANGSGVVLGAELATAAHTGTQEGP